MIKEKAIDDTVRRNNGIFLTPTLFVDYAHKMISEQLGENWKDEYVVWDNCCGSKNLTRDYKFKELYCSTLFDSELNIGERYNKEATSFQFDFLNDYIPMPGELIQSDTKIPEGLLNAFKENKKIVFFLNPPYASGKNGNGKGSKIDAIESVVSKQMKNEKINGETQNLYTQFLYRIFKLKQYYSLTNTCIAIFSPTLFLSSGSFMKFRKSFFKEFNFINGVQFKASHFADVADSWGISFSLWNCNKCVDKNNFYYKLIDCINGKIEVISHKDVYNVDDNETASEWVNKSLKGLKRQDAVQLSSGIKVKQKGYGTIIPNSLGSFVNNSNNVDMNVQNVCLFTSSFSGFANVSILPSNFSRCTSLFSSRRLIEKNWVNWQDEYLAPNEQHPQFNEFVNDSVVYSLFESKSNQSSLRQVEYKDKLWDIKNEFCWYDINMVKKLSNENNLDFTYNDASTMDQRFVYKYIQEHINDFSVESMDVLNKANEMVWKSFKYRELFNEEHPEYQILNADIGYYQLKALYKEYMKEDLEEFKKLYKVLADKMRPMVYELGFLRK